MIFGGSFDGEIEGGRGVGGTVGKYRSGGCPPWETLIDMLGYMEFGLGCPYSDQNYWKSIMLIHRKPGQQNQEITIYKKFLLLNGTYYQPMLVYSPSL